MKKYIIIISGIILLIAFSNYNGFTQNVIVATTPGDKDWHMDGNNLATTGSSVFGTTATFPQPILFTQAVHSAV